MTTDPTPSPSSEDGKTVVPVASEGFVLTERTRSYAERALTYLKIGYPVHFAGPSGTGKTTLAFHIASQLGRPVTLIHGDNEFGSSDLVGGNTGYQRSKVVDNFIHSVVRTEENMAKVWVDHRLTTCCREGHTLIYDEFTRSRPEANNVLLSVLEEGVLNLPKLHSSGQGYMEVHPEFRAIFTSNPQEYVGTHKSQDALIDRMITLQVAHNDRESEIRITQARSGVQREDAEVIIDLVRYLRGVGVSNHRPTIRSAIALARVLALSQARASRDEPVFLTACHDILAIETAKVTKSGETMMPQKVEEALDAVFEHRDETMVSSLKTLAAG